jgi:hypothetical protein
MNHLRRLANLRAKHPPAILPGAIRDDISFVLDELDLCKALLHQIVAQYDKLAEPKPDIEPYLIEHARSLSADWQPPPDNIVGDEVGEEARGAGP